MTRSTSAILSLALVALLASASRAPGQKPAFCAAYPQAPGPGQWQSDHVQIAGGKLSYPADANRNRIPDFSYAGYAYGGVPLPQVPEVARLGPASGDNTARIQAALDQIGARAPDAAGIRGALVLAPGTYDISGSVRIRHSGVVLRGSGDGADPAANTVLRGLGTDRRAIVTLGAGATWSETGARVNITTPFVQVGAANFEVQDATAFRAGDPILIRHPSTEAWIRAVDRGGCNPPWQAGQFGIEFYRVVRKVEGNVLFLDAPVFNHLDRALSQSTVARAAWNPVTLAGVENLRINILPESGTSEDHAWDGVHVNGARDAWVRKVTALHFTYAGVKVENSARVTVEDCQALDPVGVRTGARFYNFAVNRRSQLILFTGCRLTGARHGYVSNGESTVSGIVFHRGQINGGYDMEGHRHWTQGMLFDNIVENGSGTVKLINRGDWGTSHGWGSAHSVSWRFNKASQIQKPPTAQNWGVTDIGTFATNYAWPGPTGYTEKKTGKLVPESLYEAQLCERLGPGLSLARPRARTKAPGIRILAGGVVSETGRLQDLRGRMEAEYPGTQEKLRLAPGLYISVPVSE